MSRTAHVPMAKKLAWLLPAVLAMLLGSLPHLAQRLKYGTWAFLGDNDDAYYAMIARAPFHGGWSLRDPFASAAETVRVSYAWGLFVPMAKLASVFSDGPWAFLFLWRVCGGALLGVGLWLLLELLLRRMGPRSAWLSGAWGPAGLAAVLAAFMVCDPGLCYGSLPAERWVSTLFHLARGASPLSKPGWFVQFRVVSPLCGSGALLALLAVLSRPRLSRGGAVVAGLLLGALFNLYFFFWTAMVGLILVLTVVAASRKSLLRRLGVRHSASSLLIVLGIGVLLGLPQFLSDLSSFGDPVIREALERTPRGLALALRNPARWVFLTGPRLWLLCLLSVVAGWRVRALRVPALLVLLSFGLANSAVVTGLEFENYKWLHPAKLVSYVIVFLWAIAELGALAAQRARAATWVRGSLIAGLVFGLAVALVWIPREVVSTREAKEHTRWLLATRELIPWMEQLDPASLLVAPREAQPALPYTRAGILHETPHTVCSFISDAEFIERDVLSSWVLERDPGLLAQQSDLPTRFFGETRPRWTQRASRYAAAVARRSTSALDRYHVRYAVNTCDRAPAADTGPWRELFGGLQWCVWERVGAR